jgi:lipopolysaccharide transport system ATP-binding protein
MSDFAIRVENLSKRYTITVGERRHDTLRDQIAEGFRSLLHRNGYARKRREDFWALKDVSFEIKTGEVIGVIGRNGAGKSTLLKILSRITKPTAGGAEIRGRVGSLLEVGTGFHGELTGCENIYLNGAILGMKKADIDRQFGDIVAFAEVEKFIDTPVKHYSSGMYVRLAFAVAAHLEPEILIVDEVLAVGDAAFQKKCLGKMGDVAREGRTVVFVSHNMAAVENLCNKAIMLHNGKLTFSGNVKEAIDYYLRSFSNKDPTSTSHILDLSDVAGRPAKFRPTLKRLELFTDERTPLNGCLKIGASLKVCVSFRLEKPTANFDIHLGFNNHLGQRIFTVSSTFQPNRPFEDRVGDQKVVCEIPSLALVPGEYSIKVLLEIAGLTTDIVWDAARITVVESDYYGTGKIPWEGLIVLNHHWHFN